MNVVSGGRQKCSKTNVGVCVCVCIMEEEETAYQKAGKPPCFPTKILCEIRLGLSTFESDNSETSL